MKQINVERRSPVVKKEPEGIKEELQIEVNVALLVRNGKGGRVIGKWTAINDAVVPVAELKLATKPVLVIVAQEASATTFQGFAQGHGQAMAQALLKLQRDVAQGVMVEVIAEEPKPDAEDRRIVLAKP